MPKSSAAEKLPLKTPASVLSLLGKAMGKQAELEKPHEWTEYPRLRKVCKTFAMLIGTRQRLTDEIKERKDKIEDLNTEIGVALDKSGLKSVLVGDHTVTHVEPSKQKTLNKEKLINYLLNKSIPIDTIIKAIEYATKETPKKGYVLVRSPKADKEEEGEDE